MRESVAHEASQSIMHLFQFGHALNKLEDCRLCSMCWSQQDLSTRVIFSRHRGAEPTSPDERVPDTGIRQFRTLIYVTAYFSQ